jgi:signal transduction histidine kinase
MAAAMNVGVVLGMMDLLLLTGVAGPEHIYALPYATLVILVAFLYAVQRRYVQAVDEAEQATVVLAQRLAAQDAQLRAQHDRLREAENQQALWLERQRLMHDMHDGLGSALLSSLAAVERGAMAPPQVAEVLRQCADDLRLVIDSLEPIGHDVVTLLATLRYRLGPRLDAAGLKLQWRMGELPPLDWLEPPDALQVLRVVQEALTNVLKHAEAQHIRIEARTVDPHASGLAASQVEIEIADDGRGCAGVAVGSATPPAGRGVVGMRRRADRLGGSLDVHSGPNAGTRVVLRLPVQRTGKADQPNSAQDISPWSRGRHTS